VSGTRLLDLDPASREALELDAVLAYVASFAATTTGRRRLLAAVPIASAEELAAVHGAVGETVDHLVRFGRLLPGRVPDPEPALRRSRSTGCSSSRCRFAISRALSRGHCAPQAPRGDRGRRVDALRALGRVIRTWDRSRAGGRPRRPRRTARGRRSPELRRVRVAIARTSERLRRQLEAFVGDPRPRRSSATTSSRSATAGS
jgi:hypothetical protein